MNDENDRNNNTNLDEDLRIQRHGTNAQCSQASRPSSDEESGDDLMSRNKYHNRKTVVDGITFDSKGEANRYGELKLLQQAGVISDLVLQPKYVLQPKFRYNGKGIQAITWTADFEYTENGVRITEDFKGHETEAFKLRLKMFKHKYPNKTVRITRAR